MRRTLAVLATLVVLAGPAAAQEAVPAPAAEALTGVADKVSQAARALEALEARRTELAGELARADAAIAAVERHLTTIQRTSSEAVAAARQQALASYMRSEAAEQSRAVMNAIAQNNANDVAWSLGLLQVTHDHSVDVVKAATSAQGDANTELTKALADRAAVAAQAAQLETAIAGAQADLVAAQTELSTTVTRVGATVADGMTTVAYDAYRQAAAELATEQPVCGLRWELLAAIGKTESNHGGGRLDAKGDSVVPIVGIPIGADTDGGSLDLDPTHDHAVGPMQFIPSTWRTSGADGNGDGVADPNNIYDEALAAGRYLCRAAGDLTLTTRDGVIRAVLSYNPNLEYLRVVGARYEALASDVAHGWFSTGDLALPAAPVPSEGNADGGHPPSDAAFTPLGTEVHTLSVFGPNGLTTSTSGDVVTAVCGPSAVMAGRSGFLQCAPQDAAPVLDPCVVSPADPTLLACVRDPQQPVRLMRATAPQPQAATAAAPPFVALVLSGGDLCLPVAPPGTPTPPTTTPPTTPAPTTAPAPTAPASTSTTPKSTSSSTRAPTTTTTTTSTTVAPTTTTTATADLTAAQAAPTADVVPVYSCASGASVTAQPNTSTSAWTVPIVQPGAPSRTVTVTAAWN